MFLLGRVACVKWHQLKHWIINAYCSLKGHKHHSLYSRSKNLFVTHLFISQALLVHHFLQLLLPEKTIRPSPLFHSHKVVYAHPIISVLLAGRQKQHSTPYWCYQKKHGLTTVIDITSSGILSIYRPFNQLHQHLSINLFTTWNSERSATNQSTAWNQILQSLDYITILVSMDWSDWSLSQLGLGDTFITGSLCYKFNVHIFLNKWQ